MTAIDPVRLDLSERMAAEVHALGQAVTMLLSHLAHGQADPAAFLGAELDKSVTVLRCTKYAGVSPDLNEALLSLAEARLSSIFAVAGARWRVLPNEPDTAPSACDPVEGG